MMFPPRILSGFVCPSRHSFSGGTIHLTTNIVPNIPANFDAWDIDMSAPRMGKAAGGSIALRVVEKGPVRACGTG